MYRVAAALLLVSSVSASCAQTWPNGTETTLNWWQCSTGPVQFFNVTPYDQTGKNFEYPIHLNLPLMMKTDMNNPTSTYTAPNLRNTIHLWSWGGFTGCSWSSLPTLGLLSDIDACANGVPCPVKPGRQILDVIMDFTQYQQIINLLKDNAPYQLQYILNDKVTNDYSCIMIQARAFLK